MKRQFVVAGLGRFGSSVARTLYHLGHDVLAIDLDEKVVHDIMGQVTYAVQGDATNDAVLKELGIRNFDAGIVAMSNFHVSIMTAVLMKDLGVPHVVARAKNELHGKTLERIGVDRVVYPEQEAGVDLAHGLFNPAMVEDYMELLPRYGISKIKLPPHLKGLSVREAGLGRPRDKYGLALLAIKRGRDLTLLPDEDDKLEKGDILVVAGKDELLEKILKPEAELPLPRPEPMS